MAGGNMPIISYEGLPMDADNKENIIKAITDALVRVNPDIPRMAYTVYINEHPMDSVGVGGYLMDEYLQRFEDGTLEE
jgi:phenylpyruvate tautomerase PptA (4-oxalocrotonate tautomerase family)